MLRISPLTLAIIGATGLVAAGLVVIERQRPTEPGATSGSWRGEAGYLNPLLTAAKQPDQGQEETHIMPSPDVIPEHIPAPQSARPVPTNTAMPDTAKESLRSLLNKIAEGTDTSSLKAVTSLSSLEQAFTDMPKIIVPSTEKTRTPEQQAIYSYGNALGTVIQAFTASHTNMIDVVSNQAKDRTNQSHNNALRTLGNDYRTLGEQIGEMRDIPEGIKTTHGQVASTYVELGTKLAAIADSTEDKAFITAITAYNAAADSNTSAIIGLATLFSLKNITFDAQDAGAIFSFQGK